MLSKIDFKDFKGWFAENQNMVNQIREVFKDKVNNGETDEYWLNIFLWEIYDKKNPPYWAFEKGVYLEKFDSLFHIDASIKADTAYYYEKKKLWELRSNVHIRSQRGDKFDTDLLFWDEKQERVYSDKFIRIEQEDKIITGYGFESNQQMTEYQIYNNTGIFTVEDTAPADSTKAVANSTRTDSIR